MYAHMYTYTWVYAWCLLCIIVCISPTTSPHFLLTTGHGHTLPNKQLQQQQCRDDLPVKLHTCALHAHASVYHCTLLCHSLQVPYVYCTAMRKTLKVTHTYIFYLSPTTSPHFLLTTGHGRRACMFTCTDYLIRSCSSSCAALCCEILLATAAAAAVLHSHSYPYLHASSNPNGTSLTSGTACSHPKPHCS